MIRLSRLSPLFFSPVLTLFFLSAGVFSYLSFSVWSSEAFAWHMIQLRNSVLAQTLAVLFILNVSGRTVRAVWRMRQSRLRLFLRLPLFLGLIIFLNAFFLSHVFRSNRWELVGEGDIVTLGRTKEYRVVRIDPAIGDEVYRSETSDGIFRYEPLLELADPEGGRYTVKAYPPLRINGSYLHVLNFGIGPGIELIDHGQTVSKSYVALRLLPFGSVDKFEIPPYPYRFYLSILPGKTLMRGERKVQYYDLKKPRYRTEIEKGEKIILREESADAVQFDEQMRINFFEPGRWVIIEEVRDPFVMWFFLGLVLLAGGVIVYPFSFLAKVGKKPLRNHRPPCLC